MRISNRRLYLGALAVVLIAVASAGFTIEGRGHAAAAAAAPVDPSAVIAGAGTTAPLVGIATNGRPYGATIYELRDLTATWLECEYAHGAKRETMDDGSNSFRVVGVTSDVRVACQSDQDAAEAIQRTQAYADDAAATVRFTQDVLACVQSRGVADPGPDNYVGHAPYTPGLTSTEADCKADLETANGIIEPAPLP